MTIRDNDDKTKSELDPWPVIVACLVEFDSYDIPGVYRQVRHVSRLEPHRT